MADFDVTVVGELNLDLILYGLPEELAPERELLADRLTLTLGSSSAIFAHNLSALGSKVGFISRIGDDPLGQVSLERLAGGGVDVSRVRRVSSPTTTGLTVILSRPSFRSILTYPGTMFDLCYEDLDLDFLASGRHFHLSSFFLHRALRPRIPDLFKSMKSRGLTTSLDTNDDPDDRWGEDLLEALRHVDVFLPNEREAKKVTGESDLESAVLRLAEIVPVVAVKIGPEGALAQRGKKRFTSRPLSVKAVDPVGAGDSFDAGFLHQYVRGADLPTCLAYGNVAGAFSTTRPGGTEAFRDRAHLQTFLDRHWSRSEPLCGGLARPPAKAKP
ncbi:MAG: carbohydrate kinase family protein [Acidobacteria bacterium]|nr:carbohydrate kinase family protein [Acidobacteriota bacterium]